MSEDERLFLVVDPEARTHRALEAALTDQGGRVMVRESADQALEVLCSEPIDVVIASTTLADGDGFRLCSLMRGEADFDPIPLMFLSEDTSKSRRLEGLQAGAADYLSKPFFFDELQMRISALLARDVRVASGAAWTVTDGSLADRSLVEILSEVEQQGQTGTLSVAREGREAVVHFQNGQIAGAVSGTLEDKEALLGLVAWPSGEYVLRTIEGEGDRDLDPEEVVLVSIRPLEAWSEVVDGLAKLRRVFEATGDETPEVSGFDAADVTGVYGLFDGERTLGEVISTSQPDLVVTLRIVDRLLEGEWLEAVEALDDVQGPGEGEPKPDFAQWIDPTGWSAEAILEGEVEEGDFVIIPEQGQGLVSVLKSDSEPEMVTEPEERETSQPEFEEGADTILDSRSGPALESESEPESTLESDSGPELAYDSEPDGNEEESGSMLKSDSTPKFAVVEESEVEESGDGGEASRPEGPQPHEPHEPGTIEHVELALDRGGHGASQRKYSERHEEPPSERIEPEVPVTDSEGGEEPTEEAMPVDFDEPVEQTGPEQTDDQNEADVLGPEAETPVMGLDAASADVEAETPEEESTLDQEVVEGSEEASGDEESELAPEEVPTDELPREPNEETEDTDESVEVRRSEGTREPSDEESAAPLWVAVAVLLAVAVVAGTYLIGASSSDGDDEGSEATAEAEGVVTEVDEEKPVEPPADNQPEERVGEPVEPAGLEDPAAGEPDLQIVEETRRAGRQVAERIVTAAQSFAPDSADRVETDKPEQKGTSGKNDGAAAAGKAPIAESSESEQPSSPPEGPSGESQASSAAEKSADSDTSSEAFDRNGIEAIAGKIESRQYVAAERQLETLPDRLQQDAKVRDLYLDLAAAYQTEAKNVAAAKRVYQEYLALFPDGKYASEVRSILARLNGE